MGNDWDVEEQGTHWLLPCKEVAADLYLSAMCRLLLLSMEVAIKQNDCSTTRGYVNGQCDNLDVH